MTDETESPSPTADSRSVATANSPLTRSSPTDRSRFAAVETALKTGYGLAVLDPSAWRSGHHWHCFSDQESSGSGWFDAKWWWSSS